MENNPQTAFSQIKRPVRYDELRGLVFDADDFIVLRVGILKLQPAFGHYLAECINGMGDGVKLQDEELVFFADYIQRCIVDKGQMTYPSLKEATRAYLEQFPPESSANAMQGEGEEDGYSKFKYMVLRGKEHGNVFWTSGHTYRTDWYELLFETDDSMEAQLQWERHYLSQAPAREVRSAEEILNKTIENYNKDVNSLSWFKLSQREVKMFTDMMTEYANQFK